MPEASTHCINLQAKRLAPPQVAVPCREWGKFANVEVKGTSHPMQTSYNGLALPKDGAAIDYAKASTVAEAT